MSKTILGAAEAGGSCCAAIVLVYTIGNLRDGLGDSLSFELKVVSLGDTAFSSKEKDLLYFAFAEEFCFFISQRLE